MDRAQLEEEVKKRHWFHTFEIAEGLWTKGHYKPSPTWLFDVMELPKDMKGLRALDMGCADGIMAFEMARRGADVTAVDVYTPEFQNVVFLSELWNLPVKYVQSTIYEFKSDPFDIILASGVLYHLQYPLLGLHCLNALCKDSLVLESHVARGRSMTCRFYPGKELENDPSVWWVPTRKCLREMLKSAGFEIVKILKNAPSRYMIKAKKLKSVKPAFSHTDVHIANYGFPPY
jgi:tRNA (mo5U34)-methyltransferase